MVKSINIPLEDKEHERLSKLKGTLTWTEFLETGDKKMKEEIRVIKNLVEQLMKEVDMIKRNQDNYTKIFNNIHERIKEVEKRCST